MKTHNSVTKIFWSPRTSYDVAQLTTLLPLGQQVKDSSSTPAQNSKYIVQYQVKVNSHCLFSRVVESRTKELRFQVRGETLKKKQSAISSRRR